MHDVRIGRYSRAVPDSWNTLTRRQLRHVVRLLYSAHRFPTDLRLRLLGVVLDIRLPLLLAFTEVQIAQLLWLVDFILQGNGLTAQLLPSVRLPWYRGWGRYYGPREQLRNMSFAEFIFADSYFVRYCQDRTNQALLDKLVAVLYRPQRHPYAPNSPDFGGDRREDFNEHLIEKRASVLARLRLEEKLAICTWYGGCRQALVDAFPAVFTPATGEKAAGKGWDYVLREMAGGAFGNLTETSRQNARLVLAKMNDDQEAAARLRELQRQQTPY